jgi:hypothetical protein
VWISSDHAVTAEAGDLVLRESEAGEDGVGVFADVGWAGWSERRLRVLGIDETKRWPQDPDAFTLSHQFDN